MPLKNSDFISIVIPYFLRDYYLKSCLESIHELADYPFEVIVHDDSASTKTVDTGEVDFLPDIPSSLLQDSLISTLILNYGINLGLHAAANRAISLAHSKYVLFLNQDMIMTRPCLKEIVSILDKPYIGILSFYGEPTNIKEYKITNSGARFALVPGIGSGCILAFRKDFWVDVGGFDENVHSGCSDTTILYKCWKYGYFRALLVGEPAFKNRSLEEQQNKDTSIGPTGTDCAYPKIFGIPNQYKLMKERMEMCQRNQDMQRHVPASISNIDYWDTYSKAVVGPSIDWDKGILHGQTKWQGQFKRR